MEVYRLYRSDKVVQPDSISQGVQEVLRCCLSFLWNKSICQICRWDARLQNSTGKDNHRVIGHHFLKGVVAKIADELDDNALVGTPEDLMHNLEKKLYVLQRSGLNLYASYTIVSKYNFLLEMTARHIPRKQTSHFHTFKQ